MSTLKALRQALGKAVDKLDTMTGDAKAFAVQEKEVARLEGEIATMERKIRVRARQIAAEPNGAAGSGEGFANIGEMLQAVGRAANGGHRDERLIRAPSGMNEGNPADGGFPVQVDFADAILQRSYEMGEILSRAFRLGISTNANGIKIPGIDETSRATGSRWGGVRGYWLGEGAAPTASRPKFRLVELDLKKLGVLWYVTDELMQDAAALAAIAEQAFAEEITFMTEDAIIRGGGAGLPRGILGATAKVAQAAEASQAVSTFKAENAVKMWSRLWVRSRQNAVWFINQDVEPQLTLMNVAVSTAGGQLVYMPPGGLSAAPYGTLFGRPVIPVEYCESVGTEGDVILADFSQYALADKGGAQQMSSIHVAFTTDETAFRIMYRVDGQPLWHSPLTPYKGSNTKSPFVTLATRTG